MPWHCLLLALARLPEEVGLLSRFISLLSFLAGTMVLQRTGKLWKLLNEQRYDYRKELLARLLHNQRATTWWCTLATIVYGYAMFGIGGFDGIPPVLLTGVATFGLLCGFQLIGEYRRLGRLMESVSADAPLPSEA